MKTWIRLLVMLAVALLLSGADIYRHVDGQGNVTFSDSPTYGSEAVELSEPSVYSPVSPAPSGRSGQAKPAGKSRNTDENPTSYRSVRILSPEHDATLRDNQGKVTVMAITEPTLADNHQVQLVLNGKAHGEPQRNLTFRLTDIVRGEHRITLRVLDARQRRIAESSTTTFYMRQASVLN